MCSLLTTAKYVRKNPGVELFIDSHEDWNNSAQGFISREFLHRRYYGPILRRAAPAAEAILCISLESIEFVADLYRIDRERLEFFPLGGFIPSDAEYETLRATGRQELDVGDQEILIVQSGKQTRRKKLLESLRAFKNNDNPQLRFVIAGMLDSEIIAEAKALLNDDPRIAFLGWVNPKKLTQILCAADLYLQPGTQSVTMQQSLCCRCAVAIDDVLAHSVYIDSNGWLLNDTLSIEKVLHLVAKEDINTMQSKSQDLAKKLLDYNHLARRITSG